MMPQKARALLYAAFGAVALVTLGVYSSPATSQTVLDEKPAVPEGGLANVNLDYGKNNQGSVQLAVGDQFTVTLASNPTTGFQWGQGQMSPLLEKVDNKYIPGQPALIGSGGKDVYTFKALGAGSGQITFDYKRSWEPDSASQATLSFEIK